MHRLERRWRLGVLHRRTRRWDRDQERRGPVVREWTVRWIGQRVVQQRSECPRAHQGCQRTAGMYVVVYCFTPRTTIHASLSYDTPTTEQSRKRQITCSPLFHTRSQYRRTDTFCSHSIRVRVRGLAGEVWTCSLGEQIMTTRLATGSARASQCQLR